MKYQIPLLALFLVSITAEEINDVQVILDTVFTPTKYNKMIRGVKDQSKAVKVNVSFSLTSVQDINQIKQTFEVMGLLNIQWTDERLIWNPADHNNTRAIHVFQNEVWKPEILLANPSKDLSLLGDERIMIAHFFNGTASWRVGNLFKAHCLLDVTAYPWDTQICSLELMVWGYSTEEVTVEATADGSNLDYFHGNGAWELLSTTTSLSENPNLSRVIYTFELRRYPLFPVVNLIIPITTLTVLNLLAFCIPVSSGEKLSYCITVLLALAVFMSLVSGHLPKISNNMAKLCLFLMYILIMSTLICMSSVISLYLYYKPEGSHPPLWMLRLLELLSCCKRSLKINKVTTAESCEKKNPNMDVSNGEVQEVTEKNNPAAEDQTRKEITWQDVSKFLDCVFFCLTIGWLIACIGYFLFYVLNA